MKSFSSDLHRLEILHKEISESFVRLFIVYKHEVINQQRHESDGNSYN